MSWHGRSDRVKNWTGWTLKYSLKLKLTSNHLFSTRLVTRALLKSSSYVQLVSLTHFLTLIFLYGADISPEVDACSPSPLMCAVKRGHHEAVSFLLQHGSPIDLKDSNHRTCLHVAVYSSDTKTLKIIIQVKRPDINLNVVLKIRVIGANVLWCWMQNS